MTTRKKATSRTTAIKASANRTTRTTNSSATTSATRTIAVEGKPTQTTRAITRAAVAEAAYFLWLNRGGSAVENWLEAEAALARSLN